MITSPRYRLRNPISKLLYVQHYSLSCKWSSRTVPLTHHVASLKTAYCGPERTNSLNSRIFNLMYQCRLIHVEEYVPVPAGSRLSFSACTYIYGTQKGVVIHAAFWSNPRTGHELSGTPSLPFQASCKVLLWRRAVQTALLHLNPAPKLTCQTRSPFFTPVLDSICPRTYLRGTQSHYP